MEHLWKSALQAHADGDLAAVLEACDAILEVEPLHFGALQLMGAVALSTGNADQAHMLFGLAVQIAPTDAAAQMNVGSALHQLSRMEEAAEAYAGAIQLDPALPQGWFNYANTLKTLGKLDEACVAYQRCLALREDYQEAHYNWANALHQLGRFEQALERFDEALRLRPQDAEARKNRAFARLMIGEFEGGWEDYEARWLTEPMNRAWRDRGCPQWTGEQSLEGRMILLHAEQGLGDTLQFCRYAKLVKELGAALVVMEVQPALLEVLRGLPGVDALVPSGTPLGPTDFHVPLMSLPRAFGTNSSSIPADGPYLRADPVRMASWTSMLGAEHFNVGICWEGSAKGKDVGKAIPLSMFECLAHLPGVRLYALQKRTPEQLHADSQSFPWLHDFGPEFDAKAPFVDTAAAMQSLDLVISTDTSVAHLAGALAVPVWVALPWLCDWRWGHHGSTSAWYPSMQLFRQREPGDWRSCFSQIQNALVAMVTTRSRAP